MVNNSTVECPFCRTVTNIVNNDITKLLKNFALIEVIEDARYSLNKKDVVVVNSNSPPICKNHPHNLAEFVCVTSGCKSQCKLMCRTCEEFGNHKGHTRGLLQEEAAKMRTVLNNSETKLENFCDSIQSCIEQYKNAQRSFESSGATYKAKVKSIEEHFKKIKEMVAQREKETLVELKDAADCCLDDNKKKMEILSVGHQRFKQKLTDMKEFHNINQAGLLSKESQIMELVEMAKIATQSNVVNAPQPTKMDDITINLASFNFGK